MKYSRQTSAIKTSKFVLVLVGLGLCLLTVSFSGYSNSDIKTVAEEDFNKLHIEWMDQFWVYLESSDTAQFRIYSAIHLLESSDNATKERGEKLIDEVLSTPFPDPASLWLISANCSPGKSSDGCQPAGLYDMLRRADPGNMAVQLLQLGQPGVINAAELLDTEANRQLLLAAAETDRFDIYWGRNADSLYAEAFDYVVKHPAPPVPDEMLPLLPSGFPSAFPDHALALQITLTMNTISPNAPYPSILDLCREQIRQQRKETIGACKKIAGIMRSQSLSFTSQNIGYAMEKTMLAIIDPDDPDIQKWWQRQQVFHIQFSCTLQGWLNHVERWSDIDQETMMAYAKNLSELGELRSLMLLNLQDYAVSPEYFSVNPAECEKLQYLDDAAIALFLNGENAQDAWQTMQIEAGEIETGKIKREP